jgi:hypothetical protein
VILTISRLARAERYKGYDQVLRGCRPFAPYFRTCATSSAVAGATSRVSRRWSGNSG